MRIWMANNCVNFRLRRMTGWPQVQIYAKVLQRGITFLSHPVRGARISPAAWVPTKRYAMARVSVMGIVCLLVCVSVTYTPALYRDGSSWRLAVAQGLPSTIVVHLSYSVMLDGLWPNFLSPEIETKLQRKAPLFLEMPCYCFKKIRASPKTRNAWQSLAYSPLCAVESPPSEYLWKTLTYWSRQCLTAPPRSGCSWTKCGKIFDAGRTTSHVLNSGVTEPNTTKISHTVEN